MFLLPTDVLAFLLLLFGAGSGIESVTSQIDDDTCTMTELSLPDRPNGIAILLDCKFSIAAPDAMFLAANYLYVNDKLNYSNLVHIVGPEEGETESFQWVVGLSK